MTIDLTNTRNQGSISGTVRDRKEGAVNLAAARLTLRVDLGEDRGIGPGKIRLLEAIRDAGSITKAGVLLGMSYRRAWLLVDDINNCFREPVVAAQAGGTHGGGAALTAFGAKLIDQYRAIEAEAHAANATRLRELEAAVRREVQALRAIVDCVHACLVRVAQPDQFGDIAEILDDSLVVER